MRIRKRKVPLPLSLLSPVPLSDPHLFSRSPVMLVQGSVATTTNSAYNDNTTTITALSSSSQPPLSSDHFTTATFSGNISASDLRRCSIVEDTAVGATRFEVVVEGLQTSNDDASNASITPTSSATATYENNNNSNSERPPLLSNNEDQVLRRWCDGDRAIPLKKRRGIGFNSFVENPSTMIYGKDHEEDATMTTTTTIMNWNNTNEEETTDEKQIAKDNDEAEAEAVAVAVAVAAGASVKKGNAKRGNTIMEGSRCSRVNGRGWRCCQPTLVGYSLCEHHLGKGRLRSMTSSTSVKSRSSKTKKSNSTNGTKFARGRVEESETVVDSDKNKVERMSSFGNNKRVKLGVVKARSLSSLLGQTNTMKNIVTDHANMQHHEKISNLDYH